MPVKKQAKAESIQAHYERLVAQGSIKNDAAQREVLAALAALQAGLAKPRPGLFKRRSLPVRGLYIWGNVGRGKSMLMDLFFEHAPIERKRRIHFHSFMQEIHIRIQKLRQENQADPVAMLAGQLANETTLLCFDELQANDVTDATLLYRLFSGMFDAGVTIVSTSNHPPETLYTGGIQRERFAKFIALIEERMQVIALSSPDDYRQMQIKSLQKTYFHPLGPAADAFIENMLNCLCTDPSPRRDTLSVQGRKTVFTLYKVPPPVGGRLGGGHSCSADKLLAPEQVSPHPNPPPTGEGTIGRFSFHDLCETALGPADYLALAKRLDTVILTGIPILTPEKRNEAKRFVTLIDALYEHKVKLIATAAAPADQLYPEGDGAFEFKRTASRLVEMQSENWMTR